MEYFQNLDDFQKNVPTAVTVGKFDGLHLGHSLLLDDIKASGLCTVVLVLIMPGEVLMTSKERIRKLTQAGIDVLIELSFTETLAGMTPESFLEEVLLDKLHMQHLAVGTDFKFGYRASGDAAFLESHADSFTLHVIPKRTCNGKLISSSYIKELLLAGNLTEAAMMLGEPYSFTGTVSHGDKIGHTLGVPTVNIIPDPEKLLPPFGVYICTILLPDQTRECGMCNLGIKPTFHEDGSPVLEMHIFWFTGDLYSADVTIELLDHIRPEARFDSPEALKEQLVMDELIAKLYFREKPVC